MGRGAGPDLAPLLRHAAARRRKLARYGGRVLPYYCQAILPSVLRGEKVLVAAHGNSLRALVMVLDGLNATTIPTVEIHTGVPLVYTIGPDAWWCRSGFWSRRSNRVYQTIYYHAAEVCLEHSSHSLD